MLPMNLIWTFRITSIITKVTESNNFRYKMIVAMEDKMKLEIIKENQIREIKQSCIQIRNIKSHYLLQYGWDLRLLMRAGFN